jgi:hypothetical protein
MLLIQIIGVALQAVGIGLLCGAAFYLALRLLKII